MKKINKKTKILISGLMMTPLIFIPIINSGCSKKVEPTPEPISEGLKIKVLNDKTTAHWNQETQRYVFNNNDDVIKFNVTRDGYKLGFGSTNLQFHYSKTVNSQGLIVDNDSKDYPLKTFQAEGDDSKIFTLTTNTLSHLLNDTNFQLVMTYKAPWTNEIFTSNVLQLYCNNLPDPGQKHTYTYFDLIDGMNLTNYSIKLPILHPDQENNIFDVSDDPNSSDYPFRYLETPISGITLFTNDDGTAAFKYMNRLHIYDYLGQETPYGAVYLGIGGNVDYGTDFGVTFGYGWDLPYAPNEFSVMFSGETIVEDQNGDFYYEKDLTQDGYTWYDIDVNPLSLSALISFPNLYRWFSQVLFLEN